MSEQITKIGAWLPISREMAVDHGLIEPTPEERQQARVRHEEYERERQAVLARIDAARPKLNALTDPTARAVLDLHSEDDDHTCEGCDWDGFEAERPPWPCSTIRVVAEVHDIYIPERP